jgi:hypothetical protein
MERLLKIISQHGTREKRKQLFVIFVIFFLARKKFLSSDTGL